MYMEDKEETENI